MLLSVYRVLVNRGSKSLLNLRRGSRELDNRVAVQDLRHLESVSQQPVVHDLDV